MPEPYRHNPHASHEANEKARADAEKRGEKSMAKNDKVKKVMHEYKHGELHSGSKTGPKVKSRKQAIAIGLSEQRKADRSKRK